MPHWTRIASHAWASKNAMLAASRSKVAQCFRQNIFKIQHVVSTARSQSWGKQLATHIGQALLKRLIWIWGSLRAAACLAIFSTPARNSYSTGWSDIDLQIECAGALVGQGCLLIWQSDSKSGYPQQRSWQDGSTQPNWNSTHTKCTVQTYSIGNSRKFHPTRSMFLHSSLGPKSDDSTPIQMSMSLMKAMKRSLWLRYKPVCAPK